MNNKILSLAVAGFVLGVAIPLALPGVAVADNSQQHKNEWRNGAIAGGAVAAYGLAKHDKTLTILGAAGAAYSAKRYEDDRHHQSQASAARSRYHRLPARHHHSEHHHHSH